MTSSHYKLKNENNISLCKYGKMVWENIGNKIQSKQVVTEVIQLHWTKNFAEHEEVFIAKFDREVEGIRIFNITDNFII